jgi:hypothetical protein
LGWLPNTLAFKITREDKGVMENFEGELEGNNKNENFKEEKKLSRMVTSGGRGRGHSTRAGVQSPRR